MPDETGAIDALLIENREFPPSADFSALANVSDPGVYEKAKADAEAFWAGFAEELQWFSKWHTVLEWTPPHAKWFTGGIINASVNCVDRHAHGERKNKLALIFEGEPGDIRTITYSELYGEV